MDREVHNHERADGNNAIPERRVLGSYINPTSGNCGSSIQKPPIQANNFELKPQLISLVEDHCSFGGSANEDPNQHLTKFLRIYDTVKSNGVQEDAYKLLLFPFSLRDKAAKWLESFPRDSLTTWDEVESKKKTVEEAIEVIETVAENEYYYASERHNTKGVMELNHVDTILAQNKVFAKQLAELTRKLGTSQVAAIHTQDQEEDISELKSFRDDVRSTLRNHGEKLKWMESRVGELSQQAPKSTAVFPSDTEKNPKGEQKGERWEECKAITILKEVLEEEGIRPSEQEPEILKEGVEEAKQESELEQAKELHNEGMLETYQPRAPFPQRLGGGEKGKTYSRFLETFKSLHINIPFLEILQQMPTHIKYLKELLSKKRVLKGGQTVIMNKECSALIKKDIVSKKTDPGSFHIPCIIGETKIDRGFCDLGASINVMPLTLMKRLQLNGVRSTDVIIQLADKTQKQAEWVVENVLVKVGNYFFPTDFVILDMEESYLHPIILGRPFLATARALIDVEQGELILRVHDEQLIFHVFKPASEPEPELEKPKDDSSHLCLEESNPAAETLKQSLEGKQELQELKPQESIETDQKDPPGIRVNEEILKREGRIVKKLPRGWKREKEEL
ncbi:uncharacterized protein LOC127748305 [Arachis duranensis]|uniref:Uncharacterized protein LOC127748305 n=1 Tax=Arachis duranensis TaxID=130453 RepID=A0A9C6TQV2_ARADU|nr:uncharacterized protein LOC127748305 [Arachis duranensis]